MNRKRSKKLYAEATKYIPGGVNSPARAWGAVGGEPLFISRGSGAHVWDADGNRYIDYVCSWGPMILGHAHPEILNTLKNAANKGTSFGAPTEVENELAQILIDTFPSIEMVRLVSSGTEATMSAIRLARAFTGRNRIVKFDGGYHGHGDALLVAAGSGAATHGIPNSSGVTKSSAQDTFVAQYNDLESAEEYFLNFPDEIACVIVEPISGNMGVVPPQPGFLSGLRELTYRHDTLLIFDEVITGYRVTYGGAQHIYDVTPDITCLGKIIGGGLPVGAYGGRKDLMSEIAPLGNVYQAGTLSGNPLAISAGLKTLNILQDSGLYDDLESMSKMLETGLRTAFEKAGVPLRVGRVGSMMTLFFTESPVTEWQSVSASDGEKFAQFFHRMLEEGIYLPPSPFEAMFVSTVHSESHINFTIEAAERSLL